MEGQGNKGQKRHEQGSNISSASVTTMPTHVMRSRWLLASGHHWARRSTISPAFSKALIPSKLALCFPCRDSTPADGGDGGDGALKFGHMEGPFKTLCDSEGPLRYPLAVLC